METQYDAREYRILAPGGASLIGASLVGAVIRDVPIPPYLSKRAGQRRAAVVG